MRSLKRAAALALALALILLSTAGQAPRGRLVNGKMRFLIIKSWREVYSIYKPSGKVPEERP
jgi:hypothetical protein